MSSLVGLLSGRELGLPESDLDYQGWVEAYRVYRQASQAERRVLERELVDTIERYEEWPLIADIIYHARSLKIVDKELRNQVLGLTHRDIPHKWKAVVETEARRYLRDVPKATA